MGGQSFKCPLCDKWFLVKGALKNHIKDKHDLKVELEGTGQTTRIVKEVSNE